MKTHGEIAADFCDILSSAQIRYVIGGSLASGAWGDQRQTKDIDIEVWVSDANAEAFLAACQPPFDIYPPELYRVIGDKSEFRMVQVLQVEEMVKFDCFLQGGSPMDEEAFDRSVLLEIMPGRLVRVASAEHILVRKMRWYQLGNRVSERQWKDMVGIVRLAKELDWPIVARWSRLAGTEDILQELRAETG